MSAEQIEKLKTKNKRTINRLAELSERNTWLASEWGKTKEQLGNALVKLDALWTKFDKIKSLIPIKFYEIEFVSIDGSGQESHVMKRTVSDYCPEMAIDTLQHQIIGFQFKTIRLVA